MRFRGRSFVLGALVSLAIHGLLALFLWRLPPSAELAAPPHPYELEVTLAGAGSPSGDPLGDARAGRPSELVPGGDRSLQNVDTLASGGRGDIRGAAGTILLVTRADAVTAQDSPMNALRVAQSQRITTATDRASWENRRATPHPQTVPFLASGDGVHRERRPVAAVDARPGARTAPPSATRGAPIESAQGSAGTVAPLHAGEGRSVTVAAIGANAIALGGPSESPGRGIAHGGGARPDEAARVAHGRPPVDEGPAATTSTEAERVRDNRDAELLAASMVQSMVEASERSAPEHGSGRGGVGGGGDPGSGGSVSAGGRASPYGPGPGEYASLDTGDQRYLRWFLEQRDRVGRALVFPRARQLAMDQGTSVYRIVVRRDGSLARPPRLLRSSGFDDLDHAALAAIMRSAPFPPLPRDLAPGLREIRVTLPVEFSNPMVH